MTLGAEGENHHGSGPIMKTFHKVLDNSSHVCSSIKGHECFYMERNTYGLSVPKAEKLSIQQT